MIQEKGPIIPDDPNGLMKRKSPKSLQKIEEKVSKDIQQGLPTLLFIQTVSFFSSLLLISGFELIQRKH